MRIKLLKDKFIRGEPRKKDETVEVSDGVGQWLIDRGAAESIKKSKPEK